MILAALLRIGEVEKTKDKLADLSEHWIPMLCFKPGHHPSFPFFILEDSPKQGVFFCVGLPQYF